MWKRKCLTLIKSNLFIFYIIPAFYVFFFTYLFTKFFIHNPVGTLREKLGVRIEGPEGVKNPTGSPTEDRDFLKKENPHQIWYWGLPGEAQFWQVLENQDSSMG